MSRYENGVHARPLQFVKAVAKVMGVPAAFFYCRDERLAGLIRIVLSCRRLNGRR
jgi:hypothetical protein